MEGCVNQRSSVPSICMSKAKLQAAQEAYDRIMGRVRDAESGGRFADAVLAARSAWEHLDSMMAFERKYEKTEFDSVPCIDIVLKYAPLLFDRSSLRALGELLASKKAIDKHASDDLADRQRAAVDQMMRAHRLWKWIESSKAVRQRDIRQSIGGDQDEWREMITLWERMELVTRINSDDGAWVSITTRMYESVSAKCPECGIVESGQKRGFLRERECPECGRQTVFVICDTQLRNT